MQLLLDTHVLLWWVADDPKLSTLAKTLISNPDNDCYISAATAWELAIKTGQGKLNLQTTVSSYVTRHLQANAFTWLDIKLAHIDCVENLPHHHKDPFDRLLIAQAKAERLQIISADTAFDPYGQARLW
jgi:PIN domain nuclease of toxin-antitoxin system